MRFRVSTWLHQRPAEVVATVMGGRGEDGCTTRTDAGFLGEAVGQINYPDKSYSPEKSS